MKSFKQISAVIRESGYESAPTTLYSIIQRDTAIRFDTALRISNILDIPISSICKDNPYDDIETLPSLLSDNEKQNINSHKNAYISDRTARVLKKFDYTELPMVDELIADLYVLDDITRRDLFEYAKMLKKNHTSPEIAALSGKLSGNFYFTKFLLYGTVLAPLTTLSLLQSFKKGFPISRKAP